jgi:hypothetical protein
MMRRLFTCYILWIVAANAQDAAPAPASPVSLPKVVVSPPVWRDFGFSIGGKPKSLLPTKNAKFAVLRVGKSVTPGSPADKAGLKPGDIIEKVNGRAATDLTLRDVDQLLFGKKLGERVELDVRRPGEKTSKRVELAID